MKIDDDLRLVLSGAMGFDLSDAFDCNVFAIRTGTRWLLFDAGAGRSEAELLAALEASGLEPGAISHLFLTHAHADHSGGAAFVREHHAPRVVAGAGTARIVTSGDEDALHLPRARIAGVYPADYRYRACPVDTVMADGDTLTIEDARVTILRTPGHSADHMSYLVELGGRRLLVSGDALFFGGQVAIQDIPDCNIGDVCVSVRRLADLGEIDVLLPGHLGFSMANAGRHALAALEHVDRFKCPPSII